MVGAIFVSIEGKNHSDGQEGLLYSSTYAEVDDVPMDIDDRVSSSFIRRDRRTNNKTKNKDGGWGGVDRTIGDGL